VFHAQVPDVPVELGLAFIAVICADDFDPERKLIDNVIDKVDERLLGMVGIDL
jgi:hypothetical protein